MRRLVIAAAAAGAFALAGCEQDGRLPLSSRHYVPISSKLQALMEEKGMNSHAPILIRAFKKESELEVWKQDSSGEYKLLKTFPMCRWSGQLGPKKTEGDRQVPEGFYSITPSQLNPNSAFYLAFNVGYPNAYDRAYGRTGSAIMVHGICSSRGCFSMTDEQIADIYALTREAFGGGQKAIQMQSLPFRMNAENLARYRADENMPFWKNLKEGADHFDVSKREPQVSVCGRRYVFNALPKNSERLDAASACPPLQQDEAMVAAVQSKAHEDDREVAALVRSGVKAVKRIYQDGDQHPSFRNTSYASVESGDPGRTSPAARTITTQVTEMSRPDAVDHGPVDVPVEQAKGLSRQALLQRATDVKNRESGLVARAAPAAAPASAARSETASLGAAARSQQGVPKSVANGQINAGAPFGANALAAAEAPRKDEPAFYRRWLGSLGSLSATSSGTEAVVLQPVEAPLPPKAPKR